MHYALYGRKHNGEKVRDIRLAPAEILSRPTPGLILKHSVFQTTNKCFNRIHNVSGRPAVDLGYLGEALTDNFGLRLIYDFFYEDEAVIQLTTRKFEGETKAFLTLKAFSLCFTTSGFSWNNHRRDPPMFWKVNLGFANFRKFFEEFSCRYRNRLFSRHRPGPACGWFKRLFKA